MLKYYIPRFSISSAIAEHPSNHSPTQLEPTFKTEVCRWILTYLGIHIFKHHWHLCVEMFVGSEGVAVGENYILFFYIQKQKRKMKNDSCHNYKEYDIRSTHDEIEDMCV